MKTENFLRKVLASEGDYCVFASNLKRKNDIVQNFYTSIGDMVDGARDLDAKGYDAYFALATFKTPNSRKVDNVKQLKSFFLDLDCGEGKEYPNQDAAILALQGFCKTLALPAPKLVNSGRGVHVYWALSEAVLVDDWLPVAQRLKKLCVSNGFLTDTSVTADAARVLRLPSTHNHKTTPPASVEFFGIETPVDVDFDAFSELLGGNMIPVPTKAVPVGANAVMRALIGNNQTKFKDIITKTVRGTGCAQLGVIISDQANCSEPMWRAGLSIAKFCTDAEVAARNISKGHIGYSVQATAEKMELIKGPYLCTSFDEFNVGVCTECPHWGKIKSPITLGNSVMEATEEDNTIEVPPAADPEPDEEGDQYLPLSVRNATYVIPPYPKPFFRGVNGGVYIRTRNAEGDPDEKVIYHNDLYVVKRISDADVGESIVVRLHLPKDGIREFTLPLTAVTSKEELRKNMAMHGVAVTRMDELMSYMTTWVNELQATSKATNAHKQFGWVGDEFKSFVLGDQEIFANAIRNNPPSSATAGLFHAFEPKGTLQEWIDMANFYDRDGFELHQYIVGTGFGSVLMEMCPVACGGFHVHSSDSGFGKTTAMNVGASIWGAPKALVLQNKDTDNSMMLRGEVYHNLPLYIDEVTNAKGDELSDLVYQLSGGKQRNRMTSGGNNTERARGKPWSLIAVTTGNASIIEKISSIKAAPKAEAQRMMETKAVRLFSKSADKSITDVHATNAENIYGHAGVIYVQFLISNIEAVKVLLSKVRARIDDAAGLTSENRFWSAKAAATVTGVLIAKKLGLVNYDTTKLTAYTVSLLLENKGNVDSMNSSVGDRLNEYFHENWGNILKIKSTDDLRKGQGNGLDDLVIPELDPRVRLVGRYETDIKYAYLLLKPLKKWCTQQQISYPSFEEDLKKAYGAKKIKIRISRGTQTQLPATWVLAIDCSTVVVEEFTGKEVTEKEAN